MGKRAGGMRVAERRKSGIHLERERERERTFVSVTVRNAILQAVDASEVHARVGGERVRDGCTETQVAFVVSARAPFLHVAVRAHLPDDKPFDLS
jgi:hypothetical protein